MFVPCKTKSIVRVLSSLLKKLNGKLRRASPGEASRLVNVWDRPPAYYGLKGRDTIHTILVLITVDRGIL